jgi:deoxyadenosine/deoxycytidine kinase
MKIALSGYAGCGKSTIVDRVALEYPYVTIFPESAREVNIAKDFYEIQDNGDFFQKSVMDNEIMKVTVSHLNRIENAIFDRTVIDNFTFGQLYYSRNRVNYEALKKFFDDFYQRFNVKHVYDIILFINITQDENYIEKYILNDQFRRDTTASEVKKFIEFGKVWEQIYFDTLDKMKIAKEVVVIDHFVENENYDRQVTDVLTKAFRS